MTDEQSDGPPPSPDLPQNPGAMPDLGALMSQVFQAKEALDSAHAQAASQLVTGSAGGGAVQVQVTGGLEFRAVTIDPAVIDPNEADLLGDLVLAAIRDATEKAAALGEQALGGLDLGALKGFLGGP